MFSARNKARVTAAGAVLALTAGLGAVTAVTSAQAATPSCGSSCVDVFSKQFGTFHHPGFALDTLSQGKKIGQPQILFRTSNSDPAEDYTVSYQGTVSDFFAAGLVSSAVELHYGGAIFPNVPSGNLLYPNDFAYEIQYSPFGVDSGLCAGLTSTAFAGEKVSLQPCGVSAKTVWIIDTAGSPATITHGYVPLVNGSDTNFSHPYVLHYPSGYPTDKPRVQLDVTAITGFSQGTPPGPVLGSVNSNQLWGADLGPLK